MRRAAILWERAKVLALTLLLILASLTVGAFMLAPVVVQTAAFWKYLQ